MAIATDFEVQANKNIRHVAGTDTYTVIEFHRYLQDLADNPDVVSDDLISIVSESPSERSTDNIITLLNGYNIDDDAAKYLYDGSITQGASGSETVYAGLVVVGNVPATGDPADNTELHIIQNNSDYDTCFTSTPFWGLTNEVTGVALNGNAQANILTRLLVKVKIAGVEQDGQRIRVQARHYSHTNSEFEVTMGLGNNTAAIFTSVDLNNQKDAGVIAAAPYDTIVDSATGTGYTGLDVDDDGTNEFYYSNWTKGSQTINDIYERAKWIQSVGTNIHGIDGRLFRGITHEITLDASTTPTDFAAGQQLQWDSDASTGLILAVNDGNAPTKVWIQLLTGVAPTDNDVLENVADVTSTMTVDTSGTAVLSRPVSSCFLGQSTGTSIIGAYGIGITPADLGTGDTCLDLANSSKPRPNFVTFTVSGLEHNEDYVIVTRYKNNTDLILKEQHYTVNTLTGDTNGQVEVTLIQDEDTPVPGHIRLELDNGTYKKLAYNAVDRSGAPDYKFILTSNYDATAVGNDVSTAGNEVFISYIDKLAQGDVVLCDGTTDNTVEGSEYVIKTEGTTNWQAISEETLIGPSVGEKFTRNSVPATGTGGDVYTVAASEDFTVKYIADRDLFVRVRDGGSASPIKTFETPATLTSAGGTVAAIRTNDS